MSEFNKKQDRYLRERIKDQMLIYVEENIGTIRFDPFDWKPEMFALVRRLKKSGLFQQYTPDDLIIKINDWMDDHLFETKEELRIEYISKTKD